MGYGVKVRVFGDYACFTRPEMKAERVSYDVMTPSAARGILEAIYWKPAIEWKIDRIHILNQIKFTNVRRNEVSENIKYSTVKSAMTDGKKSIETSATDDRTQRATLALQNVEYVIEAHFKMTDKAGETDTEEKHYNIALRRLRKGQCYHRPCLGTREFGAGFEFIEEATEIQKSSLTGELQLGYMLYDMDYKMTKNKKADDSEYSIEASPKFFKAEVKDGILDLRDVRTVG